MLTTPFHVTAEANEVLVAYRDGALQEILRPGRYRRVRRTRYVPVGTAWRMLLLAPQEVPTADGASVKATAVIQHRMTDAERFLSVEDATQVVYLAVQIGLRDAFATLTAEEAAQSPRTRPELAAGLTQRAAAAGREVGIEVASVVVKDVILPQELRRAALAAITAKAEGQARLEAARAETAALRTLANGAKILADHPALAQLRMVQSIPPGASLGLHLPADAG